MRGGFRLALVALTVPIVLFLGACAAVTAIKTGQPLNQAQVQQDAQTAAYLLKAAGCTVATVGAEAAPVVAISADAQGRQVLQAVDAAGQLQCAVTVPPVALPVPAQANAPPAVSTAAPVAPASSS